MNGKVYPTMVTPFTKAGAVSYDGIRDIVEWYIEKKCSGIFAVCQSSEMSFLTLEEKIEIVKTVVEQADGRISVVASGHCADGLEDQIQEINAISEMDIDAFVLNSNRFDLHNEGDEVWIKNAEFVLSRINPDISLGIYECPLPYKRLLSDKILNWCIETKRFTFLKDTCCDFGLLRHRLELLKDSDIALYNANAQTLLHSLRYGAAGYSGVMANFHPELYVWLCENGDKDDERVELVQSFLGLYAFTESMAYPITAKYHMNFEGIHMELNSRWKDKSQFTEYQRLILEQETNIEQFFKNMIA